MTHNTTEGHEPGEERSVSVLSEVSNEMVRLYKDQFGRGPTRARTAWAGNDTLVVRLEDTLTPAERNLVKMGEHQRRGLSKVGRGGRTSESPRKG